jgi:hypothetical protein
LAGFSHVQLFWTATAEIAVKTCLPFVQRLRLYEQNAFEALAPPGCI